MMDGGSYLVHLELRKCILFKSIGLSKSFFISTAQELLRR